MSIIARIRRIAAANLNELLDKAEAPEKMLKQKIRELEQAIKDAKEALAGYAAAFKKVEREEEQLKRLRDEWGHKAEESVRLGDDALARTALGEKLKAAGRLQSLGPSVSQSRATYRELRENLATLQDQLHAARLRMSELQTRRQAAQAQKAFGEKLDRAAGATVGDGDFGRMEAEVLKVEAEAEIERDIRGDLTGREADLDRKTQQIRVDAELASLKQKLGKKGRG